MRAITLYSMMTSSPSTVKIAGGTLFICTLLTIRRLELRDPAHWTLTSSARKKPVRISYDPPSNDVSNNTFLATFERLMGSADLSLPQGYDAYVPLIVQHDGRILCRGSHKDVLSKARVKHYIEMLSVGRRIEREKGSDTRMNYPVGLRTRNDRFKPRERERESDGGHGILPVILVGSDNSGCTNTGSVDNVGFPRLAWHIPSPKYGNGWCQAVGMVGYTPWEMSKFSYNTWDWTFKWYNWRYPWSSKIDKAFWRGSTTGLSHSFDELPRAKLVRKSMERPDLIDAGFTGFCQGFKSMTGNSSTITAKHVRFNDQMKYKAIIDIDGNTWSSRFTKLLCTNSVIIKVRY